MKTSVDLTENRMFSRPISSDISLAEIIMYSKTKTRVPWKQEALLSVVEDDTDLIPRNYHALIITGSKEEREQIRYYKHMDSEDYCDCCGKYMNKIPWNKGIGICWECHKAVYENPKEKYENLWGEPYTMQGLDISRL